IGTLSPNTKVTITYLRDKKIYKGDIKLASSKGKKSSNAYGYEYEGIHVESLTSQLRKQLGIPNNITGVYVNGVDEKSNASKAGIMQGDIII
ncbi:serine protease, partial [Aliarcobacter butzleri]|nr:serine protease [Aliarcobacter butzleri]